MINLLQRICALLLLVHISVSYAATDTESASDESSEPPTNVSELLNALYNDDSLHGVNNTLTPGKEADLQTTAKAKIIVLNKITAKAEEVILSFGEVKFFGNLSIELRQCIKSDDPYQPDNMVLLSIFDNKTGDELVSVFDGWILSSSPSLSILEHPVYEVIVRDCL